MTMHLNIESQIRSAQRRNEPTRALNLSLQGSGTHGAFGWGVLDKLLEDGRIDIAGIAATSTGAINAVLHAHGVMRGGNAFARASLEQFWRAASEKVAWLSPLERGPVAMMFAPMEPLVCRWLESMSQIFSPYELNPLNANPLRDTLLSIVDFEELHRFRGVQLSLCATNVRSGAPRIFSNRDISIDAVLAASCLPTISQAIQIEGEYYWEGAYCGYPTIAPLLNHTDCRDLLIAQISPIERRDIPRRAGDIQSRINEIALHASLMRETSALGALCTIDEDWIRPEYRHRVSRTRVHAIRAEEYLSDLTLGSKFDSSWQFLARLRDRGRLAAELWLEAHFEQIGVRSTIGLHAN